MRLYVSTESDGRINGYTTVARPYSAIGIDNGEELEQWMAAGILCIYVEDGMAVVRPTEAEQADTDEKLAIIERGFTDQQLLDAIVASVTIPDKPASKEGFLTVWHYDSDTNSVVWTFEPDPNYTPDEDGSYLKPYTFTAPMEVELGKWYTDGEDIWECVEAGMAEAFTAPWFDVIAV